MMAPRMVSPKTGKRAPPLSLALVAIIWEVCAILLVAISATALSKDILGASTRVKAGELTGEVAMREKEREREREKARIDVRKPVF